MAETMMLGLRMTAEGVDCERFAARYGVHPREAYPAAVADCVNRALLESDTTSCLRLTSQGVFLANEVMMAFI
jgi:oxygen-independent coproporphyrinogen-3 oxidase